MPGTIKATVLEAVDLPGSGGKKYLVKVSLGSREFKTGQHSAHAAGAGTSSIRSYNSDFSFSVQNLTDPVLFTLLDARNETPVGKAEIKVPTIVEKGFRDELLPLSNGGKLHVKTSFVLSEEERAKIAQMRANTLKKKQQQQAQEANGNSHADSDATPTAPDSAGVDVAEAKVENRAVEVKEAGGEKEPSAPATPDAADAATAASPEAEKDDLFVDAKQTTEPPPPSSPAPSLPLQPAAEQLAALTAYEPLAEKEAEAENGGGLKVEESPSSLAEAAAVVVGEAATADAENAATEELSEAPADSEPKVITLSETDVFDDAEEEGEDEEGAAEEEEEEPKGQEETVKEVEPAASEPEPVISVSDRQLDTPAAVEVIEEAEAAAPTEPSPLPEAVAAASAAASEADAAAVVEPNVAPTPSLTVTEAAAPTGPAAATDVELVESSAAPATTADSPEVMATPAAYGSAPPPTPAAAFASTALPAMDPFPAVPEDEQLQATDATTPAKADIEATLAAAAACLETVSVDVGNDVKLQESAPTLLQAEGRESNEEDAVKEEKEEERKPLQLGGVLKRIVGGIVVAAVLSLLWPKQQNNNNESLPPKAKRSYKPGDVLVVKPGDTLSSILPQEHLCNPKSKFFQLNPEVCDINYIYEGQRLYLP